MFPILIGYVNICKCFLYKINVIKYKRTKCESTWGLCVVWDIQNETFVI